MGKIKAGFVSGFLALLLFVALYGVLLSVPALSVKAHLYGIIHIQSNGTIDPSTAPIQRIGDTYVLTANVTTNECGIDIERNNTIFDGASYTVKGDGWDWGIFTGANNVTVKNTRVEGFGQGIMVRWRYNVVVGNTITLNHVGVYINQDFCNTIVGNNISDNTEGILLSSCEENEVRGNNISGNRVGIYLDNAWDNTISGNNIERNGLDGIYARYGHKWWPNRIVGNNIRHNGQFGIQLDWGEGNCFYHNNFINNTSGHVWDNGWNNTWFQDYPCCGNYWSNYGGDDLYNGPYQNLSGSDGIGDSPHSIYGSLTDDYPLMGMFIEFSATLEQHVQTICNSTISDFQFNGTVISFNVSGENDTTGFCRICIPTALMNATHHIFVNGTETSFTLLPCSNATHSYLYFNYTHSTQEVIIIPEFPAFLILPMFMMVTLLAVSVYRRKHSVEATSV